ncbi:hypothetical protein [Streptomyces cacaoi]|uniref:hypothetical protein n=1 Tax=Streptomyces cacaoi TaxID=1898 RepID=UPI00260EDCF5|nr:hypothetical protein [Streptomyces cacaoi]
MSLTSFDLAIGLDATSLNTGMAELHSKHHDAVFTGRESTQFNGEQAVLTWDVRGAPTVVLSAPSQDEWDKATDAGGKRPPTTPLPSENVLRITLTNTDAALTNAGQTTSVTGKDIDVYGAVSAKDGKLSVTVLAVRLDTAGMDSWKAFFVQHLVIPHLVKAGGNALSQLTIPTQELFGEKLTLVPDQALITGTHLVLATAADIDGNATPDPLAAGFTWPDKPLWALFSRRLIEWVLDRAIREKALGKQQHFSQSSKPLTISADYRLRGYTGLRLAADSLTNAQATLDMAYGVNISPLGIDPDKCALFNATKSM